MGLTGFREFWKPSRQTSKPTGHLGDPKRDIGIRSEDELGALAFRTCHLGRHVLRLLQKSRKAWWLEHSREAGRDACPGCSEASQSAAPPRPGRGAGLQLGEQLEAEPPGSPLSEHTGCSGLGTRSFQARDRRC